MNLRNIFPKKEKVMLKKKTPQDLRHKKNTYNVTKYITFE